MKILILRIRQKPFIVWLLAYSILLDGGFLSIATSWVETENSNIHPNPRTYYKDEAESFSELGAYVLITILGIVTIAIRLLYPKAHLRSLIFFYPILLLYLGVYSPVFFQNARGTDSGFLVLGIIWSLPFVALFVFLCGNVAKVPKIWRQLKGNPSETFSNTKMFSNIKKQRLKTPKYRRGVMALAKIPVFKYRQTTSSYSALIDKSYQIIGRLKNYIYPSLYLFAGFGFSLLAIFIINRIAGDIGYIWALLPLPLILIVIAGALKYKKPEMRLWFFALVFSAMMMIFHGSENNVSNKAMFGLIFGFCIGIMLVSMGALLGEAFNRKTNVAK